MTSDWRWFDINLANSHPWFLSPLDVSIRRVKNNALPDIYSDKVREAGEER